MLIFIAGTFLGAFTMLIIMSLMYAAKEGDRQCTPQYFNDKLS